MITKKYLLYASVTGIILLLTSFFVTSDFRLAREGQTQLKKLLSLSELNVTNVNVSHSVEVSQVAHVHKDLFTRNLTLINITNFKFIINNDICNTTPISLVVIVHSAPQNNKARDIIRSTWGTPDIPYVMTKLVFLLGQPKNKKAQDSLEKENEKHHDLVQGMFSDTYANLSYKNIMGKLWVSNFCEKAEFVLKTDDDMFVDLYEVFALTRRYITNIHYQSNSFILCPVWRGLPILRDPASKWFVPYETIPKDKNAKGKTEFYPTDCTGWIYITNPGTANRLAKAAQTNRFFWIDDVWVTGYLAKALKIQHQDMMQFWTMKAGALLLYKSIQNPLIYHNDFISGPMDRDLSLSMALHRRARWCYQNKCYNNIYYQHNPLKIGEMVNSQMIKKFFPDT
eukprot:GFUD01036616.1.p1 GENE.GFUD01036616.1~~GFUD01036616.1.p1  ORF type:complete len:397 (+),score=103.23 GFUD01036616.1:92-1282(+)